MSTTTRKDAKNVRVYPEDWAVLKKMQLEAILADRPSTMADIIHNLLVNRGEGGKANTNKVDSVLPTGGL